MAKTVSITSISIQSIFFVTSKVLVIMLTFHEVSSRHVKLPKTSEFLIKSKEGSVFKRAIKSELTKYFGFEKFITMNDDKYPEKALVYVIDETKRLMQSCDTAPEQRIKIHKPYDSAYLGHLVLSFKDNLNSDSEDESCKKSVTVLDLKYLTNYYVVRTENIKYNLTVVICRRGESCGSTSIQPFGYESVCTQVYSKIDLIRRHVNENFKAENQEPFSIYIPTGCKCSHRRQGEEIDFSMN